MTLGSERYSAQPWGERLRAWREEAKHWSRNELRDEIEAASHKTHEVRGHRLDVRLIGRWETGAVRQPQAVYCRLLAHLGAPLPNTADCLDVSTEEDDMERRKFLLGAGAAVAAAVGAIPATMYGGRQVPPRVDALHIEQLRRDVNALYVKDQAHGAGGLAESAHAYYLDARRMLDESDYPEPIGHDLMLIAGELAVCVGWLSYDAGDQRRARDLYSEAFFLADQAGDERLAIQAMEKMTLQSAFIADKARLRGAGREAARTSLRAIDLSRRQPSGRLHALLAGREAIAHAVVGDETKFRVSARRAWREIDRAGHANDDEMWLRFVTPGEVAVHEAKGYRYLGRPDEAARLYRASLEEPSLSPRNRANYQAQLASALVALNNRDEALAIGNTTLPTLVEEIASPRTLAELAPVRRIAHLVGDNEFCRSYDKATGATFNG